MKLYNVGTLEPLYKTVHYKMVFDIRHIKDGPQKCCSQTKMFRCVKIDLRSVVFKQKSADYIEK